MDVENLLISAVVAEGDLGPAANITADFFSDPASARVWRLITEHKARYGNVPTAEAIAADYPTYRLADPEESLAYLTDRMIKHRSLVLLEAAIHDAATAHVAGDLDRAVSVLHGGLAEISKLSVNDHDVNLAENIEERIDHYRELAKLDGRLRGIPSGFPFIDEALFGFEKGQLITFVGPPKVGKSTAMLLMARAALENGYSPFFVGFEMANREQYERFDAIRAGISHKKLRTGTLSKVEWEELEKAVRRTRRLPDFYMTQDTASVMTLTGLRTKIEKVQPDIVFVDGVYMMHDEMGEKPNSPQALTNLTRGLKRMAQHLRIPIVIATQALESKMHGGKLGPTSIGYSSSFLQDSDAIFGAERTEDPFITKMILLRARNALSAEAYYAWGYDPPKFAELPYNPFGEPEEDDDYSDFKNDGGAYAFP